MPLFGKFSIKKTPPRKSSVSESVKDIEQDYNFLEGDDDVVRLCLGDTETVFDNGEWVPESGVNSQNSKTSKKLRKEIQTLKEENNLLQLKINILLDMLTETTAEKQLQKHQLEKIKRK